MFASLLAAAALATAPQEYDTRHFDVREISNAEGCAIKSHWTLPGRSPIYVQIDLVTDGEITVAVSSYGWSRPANDEGKVLALALRSPGAENDLFIVGALPLTDLPYGLVGMIQTGREDEFLEAFASNQTLSVLTADHVEDDEEYDFDIVLQAGLQDSSNAVASLRRCVANVKRREDARRAREATVDHIARDPFAPRNTESED